MTAPNNFASISHRVACTPLDPQNQQLIGPLSEEEWRNLDNWAFQEFPRDAYESFRKIWDYHMKPDRRNADQ